METNIHEAKTHLSRLLDRAIAGEEIIIAKSGHALVKLVAVERTKKQRSPGSAKGLVTMTDDFNVPLPSEIEIGFWS